LITNQSPTLAFIADSFLHPCSDSARLPGSAVPPPESIFDNWTGPVGLPTRIAEHLEYTALALILDSLLASAVSVPVTGRAGQGIREARPGTDGRSYRQTRHGSRTRLTVEE